VSHSRAVSRACRPSRQTARPMTMDSSSSRTSKAPSITYMTHWRVPIFQKCFAGCSALGRNSHPRLMRVTAGMAEPSGSLLTISQGLRSRELGPLVSDVFSVTF
jgi:hypothetical protein